MNSEQKESNASNFEAIIAQEVGDMDLEIGTIAAEKISEVVGEGAAENKATTAQTQDKKDKKGSGFVSGKVADLLWSRPQKNQPLPTPVKQKKAVQKALTKRTRKLVRKAAQIEKSKSFSAAQLEEVMLEIRHLQQLLKDLAQATIEKIETLYHRYVAKS